MAQTSSSENIVSTNSLHEFLASEAALVQEASAALPHRFDACTHSLGYIRQAVYLCLTCSSPRGLCSACSIACHGDHEQVELFPKRAFRCDCPTSALSASCNLHRTLEDMNDRNVYSQNFKGKFCRCGRPYNAATEKETMLQCLSCEDWYHESCLRLRNKLSTSHDSTEEGPPIHVNPFQALPPSPKSSNDIVATLVSPPPLAPLVPYGGTQEDGQDDESDDEDDPALLIQPSSYESLICGSCVRKSAVLKKWAGTPGARIIIWDKDQGKWDVLGDAIPNPPDMDEEVVADDDIDVRVAATEPPNGSSKKRSISPTHHAHEPGPSKKARLSGSAAAVACTAPVPSLVVNRALSKPLGHTSLTDDHVIEDGDSECDIFLTYRFRNRWCRCQNCRIDLEREPYLGEEEPELYEPPEDPDSTLSLEELGLRALQNLPRDKAIDGIRAYNKMRDDLISYLRPFAREGKVVSEMDMKGFFEQRRASGPLR